MEAGTREMTNKGRRRTKSKATAQARGGAITGYEAELWGMADALRGSMDAAEYKHVVLGLVFLKYISDAFEEKRDMLEAEVEEGADPEDPDEYRAENIFWVPQEARWEEIRTQARLPTIGRIVDEAMVGIERDNPVLKGVLPKDYARPALDKRRLGEIIDLIGKVKIGDEESRSKDVRGRVYEYFLARFADAEGKRGGEFYTPQCIVRLLVEMLQPYNGRVYDPCCGSSGMFVQSMEFMRAHATGNGNGGRARARHLHLRPGVQLHHVAAGEDEPGHPGDRGSDRSWGHVPRRSAPGSESRLHPRQSSVQYLRLGRHAAAGRQALEVWNAAAPQRQLCLGSAHDPSPGAQGRGRIRAGQRFHVLQAVR